VELLSVELLPVDADPDLLRDFVAESRDYLAGAESALLELESDPDDTEAVNTIFRAFHTIKGTSSFLALDRISELAHRAEELLDRVRRREIRCTGGYADLALRAVDMLKDLLAGVAGALDGAPVPPARGYDVLAVVLASPEDAGIGEAESGSGRSPSAPRLGDILVAEGCADREAVEHVLATKGETPLGEALVIAGVATERDVAAALRRQGRSAESSVRVRTDRLDRLVDMVGELVIAHSMLGGDVAVQAANNYELSKKVAHAGKIVRELQDLSMAMRMVPLRATFQKMARLVRDLSQKTGKPVELALEGEDTEIDRNMVDALGDPLVHMIRNAIDHGIESPAEREAAGKPRTGVVRLSASHQGGSVIVELRDDGRGLDRERIVAKAVERGLIASASGLSDAEAFNLIFAAGFSTAARVTDVSGRGVGMDVVRRNVEALRGRIDIASAPGRGSTFTMRLPLTMAITDGMLVRIGDERYIVPTVHIHLSFRPEASMLSTVAGKGEMVLLRGELMPIVRLHRLFATPGAAQDPTRGLLVVVGDGAHRTALLVDELLGQLQVVAKPVGDGIESVPGISGAAILGDGRVGLILDVAAIEAMSRRTGGRREPHGESAAA
jgi:two-component system chemotaxis sensor kinase CheA